MCAYFSPGQRVGAEFLGSAFLLATVIGSGIMGARLSGGNEALTLLGNTLPTGAMLVVLITMFSPISGAHFNPAVTGVFWLKHEITPRLALGYILAQLAGGIAGVLAAHLMFDLPLLQALGEGPQWSRAVVCRVHSDVWAGPDDPRNSQSQAGCPAHVGRPLHHRRLLVYSFDVLRQSRRHAGKGFLRHVRGDTFCRCYAIRCRATWRRILRTAIIALAAISFGNHGRFPDFNAVDGGVNAMTITIYHNPSCGTSRNTLAMIRASGEEPEIIEYLETPPTRDRLFELLHAMGMSARELLRKNVPPYHDLKLDAATATEEQLVDLMVLHPLLINRPIVVTPLGVKLCRPSEAVLDILPNPAIGTFTKEDGEVVVGISRSGKA